MDLRLPVTALHPQLDPSTHQLLSNVIKTLLGTATKIGNPIL